MHFLQEEHGPLAKCQLCAAPSGHALYDIRKGVNSRAA